MPSDTTTRSTAQWTVNPVTTANEAMPAPGTARFDRTIDGGLAERREMFNNFARDIGRPVFVNNPHNASRGTPPEEAQEIRRVHYGRFVVSFFNVPGSRTLNAGGCASGVAQDPNDPHREYMFDGTGITSARGLDRSLDTWAERAGTQFIKEIPLHWVQKLWGSQVQHEVFPVQGYDVAYLFKDHLFIPFDLPHFPGDEPVTGPILAEASEALVNEEPQSHDERREQRARIMREVRTVQTSAVLERIESRGREWLNNLSSHTRRRVEREHAEQREMLENLRSQYLNALHHGRELEATLAGLEGTEVLFSEEDLAELKRMVENGTIQDIEFHDGPRGALMRVKTKTLLAFDDRTGAYHMVGRMWFDANMVDGRLKYRNMDRHIRDCHAPHVFNDGRPCMGNFAEMVADMVAEGNWLGLIQGAILFVETANTQDSAGRYVHAWPFCDTPEDYGYPAYENPVDPLPPDASPSMVRAVAGGTHTPSDFAIEYEEEEE